jgi:transcriptional regulator with XRE-family HTH domain
VRQPTTFAVTLRKLRESHGISQSQLATALRLKAAQISGVETGQKPVLATTHFLKLRKALHLTPKELVELRRARLITMLEQTFADELTEQPIEKMREVLRRCRPGKKVQL